MTIPNYLTMTHSLEGQKEGDFERQNSKVEDLRKHFSERVRKACEGNAQKLKNIYDVWEMPVGLSIHLMSPGYMDLVIERLYKDRISMTHYGEMNGDLMKDPDMEIQIASDGSWVRPLSYQNDYVAFYQSLENTPHPKLEEELTSFFSTWLENLEEQGFGRPSAEEAKRREEEREKYQED